MPGGTIPDNPFGRNLLKISGGSCPLEVVLEAGTHPSFQVSPPSGEQDPSKFSSRPTPSGRSLGRAGGTSPNFQSGPAATPEEGHKEVGLPPLRTAT